MSERKNQSVVIRLMSVLSQIPGNPAFAAEVRPNSVPIKCGRCKRGVIINWPWGEEPTIRSCRVCGAKTNVEFIGRIYTR